MALTTDVSTTSVYLYTCYSRPCHTYDNGAVHRHTDRHTERHTNIQRHTYIQTHTNRHVVALTTDVSTASVYLYTCYSRPYRTYDNDAVHTHRHTYRHTETHIHTDRHTDRHVAALKIGVSTANVYLYTCYSRPYRTYDNDAAHTDIQTDITTYTVRTLRSSSQLLLSILLFFYYKDE